MREDRVIAGELLGGRQADDDIILFIGRVEPDLAGAGEHGAFGAELAGIAARPTHERQGLREAKGFEAIEPPPGDLMRVEHEIGRASVGKECVSKCRSRWWTNP